MEYWVRLAGINKKSRKGQPATLSSPEIRVNYAPLGRETLEAIASELAPERLGSPRAQPMESSPEIVVGTTALGRETLAAIEAELKTAQPAVGVRPKVRRGRSSRPPSGKRSEPKERRLFADAIPEIIVKNGAAEPAPTPAAAPMEIFEMLTFVVKNVESGEFSTEGLRRAFVEQHLSHCLRGHTLGAIARVDVTPWTERGAVVARIWCRV